MAVLDVGGLIHANHHQYIRNAVMGSAYQRCFLKIPKPRVALLNIGVESTKGTVELGAAYKILSSQPFKHMEFIGNIEGREAFDGDVDVIVTDGFSGNVFLKTSEGTSRFIMDTMKQHLLAISSELKGEFQKLQGIFDFAEYQGATLCGVDGIVVKCHGTSCSRAILHGIEGAYTLIKKNFISEMKKELKSL